MLQGFVMALYPGSLKLEIQTLFWHSIEAENTFSH